MTVAITMIVAPRRTAVRRPTPSVTYGEKGYAERLPMFWCRVVQEIWIKEKENSSLEWRSRARAKCCLLEGVIPQKARERTLPPEGLLNAAFHWLRACSPSKGRVGSATHRINVLHILIMLPSYPLAVDVTMSSRIQVLRSTRRRFRYHFFVGSMRPW